MSIHLFNLTLIVGAYQVCFDNTASRFGEKLVYMYMVTYITEEWTKYLEEIQSVSSSVQNFTVNVPLTFLILKSRKIMALSKHGSHYIIHINESKYSHSSLLQINKKN